MSQGANRPAGSFPGTAPEQRKTEDRDQPRFAVNQQLSLVRRAGAVCLATMINVSRDGFGLRVPHALAPGERVLLRSGLGDVPGEICWSTNDRAGGLFVQPSD